MEPSNAHPSTAAERTAPTTSRIAALDGLRGVAALVVVVHHALLAVVASLGASLWRDYDVHGTTNWLLSRTPLQILWGGHEAVLVFFVLSGVVLALPHAEGRGPAWISYYASRALRLYVPVWGALILAVVLATITGWNTHGAGTTWLLDHGRGLHASGVAQDATLTGPPSKSVITALWSLRWEVAFSALLPLYLLAARTVRADLLALIALAMIGFSLGEGAGTCLPVFLLGVLLAYRREQVIARLAPLGPAALAAALAATVVLLTGRAWGTGLGLSFGLTTALVSLGAMVAVALAIAHPAVQRVLTFRGIAWLGSRSFALYLVHEPIITSLGYVTGRTPPAIPFLGLAVVVALGAAELFFRTIERPSHRLARSVGRALASRTAAAPAGTGAVSSQPAGV